MEVSGALQRRVLAEAGVPPAQVRETCPAVRWQWRLQQQEQRCAHTGRRSRPPPALTHPLHRPTPNPPLCSSRWGRRCATSAQGRTATQSSSPSLCIIGGCGVEAGWQAAAGQPPTPPHCCRHDQAPLPLVPRARAHRARLLRLPPAAPAATSAAGRETWARATQCPPPSSCYSWSRSQGQLPTAAALPPATPPRCAAARCSCWGWLRGRARWRCWRAPGPDPRTGE